MTTKKKLAERLPMKMSDLVQLIAKIEIAPKQKYLVLEVCSMTNTRKCKFVYLQTLEYVEAKWVDTMHCQGSCAKQSMFVWLICKKKRVN